MEQPPAAAARRSPVQRWETAGAAGARAAALGSALPPDHRAGCRRFGPGAADAAVLRYGRETRRHASHDFDGVAGRVVCCEDGREPALNPLCAQSASLRYWPLLWRRCDQPAKEFARSQSASNRPSRPHPESSPAAKRGRHDQACGRAAATAHARAAAVRRDWELAPSDYGCCMAARAEWRNLPRQTARAPRAREAGRDQHQVVAIPGFRLWKAGGSRTEQVNRLEFRAWATVPSDAVFREQTGIVSSWYVLVKGGLPMPSEFGRRKTRGLWLRPCLRASEEWQADQRLFRG